LLLTSLAAAAERRAKNVILFIGDAGGIATLNAASRYGHNGPGKLFVQNMSHQGLMETSAANALVTDSAAAMSAIVTGQKTDSGVISQMPEKDGGKKLETILEYAEEHGLSTGVITNSPIADATPAACYAHAAKRSMTGEIFAQILTPRFGNGIEVAIGPGRKAVVDATAKLGIDIEPELKKKGYAVYDSVAAIGAKDRRVVVMLDSADFKLQDAVTRAVAILSRNPKGFFLMVEGDLHTNNIKKGLDNALELDGVIRQTAAKARPDTLIIFSADHSFDFRLQSGKPGVPLLEQTGGKKPAIRVDNSHTGEEVLVSAQGPGSERVHGFFANTDLFHVMMRAYGWEGTPAPAPAVQSVSGGR
jgi:alkaline phosphatase